MCTIIIISHKYAIAHCAIQGYSMNLCNVSNFMSTLLFGQ